MSQLQAYNQLIQPAQLLQPVTMLNKSHTTPLRLFGTIMLLFFQRMPKWTLSQQHSAHQKPQPSHLFQTCHGHQHLTPVQWNKQLYKLPILIITLVLHFLLQLNQQPICSGHLLMLPNLLVDGDLSLLRSWHTELDSENLSVPSVSHLTWTWT